MTFKDKEKEISDFIERVDPGWYIDFSEDEDTIEFGFYTDCYGIFNAEMTKDLTVRIYCPITKFIFWTKEERDFIQQFTKFLEELGFKEGE